jgi:hypothetical protein
VSAAAEKAAANGSPALDRIAGLLALIATKDMQKDDAALALDAIGFSAADVSGLLGVNSNYVQVARFRRRKAGRTVSKKA